MHPNATNGLDTALGEAQITLPPVGVFGAAMKLDNGILTQTDYRPGYSTYIGDKIYNFVVQPNLDTIVFFRMNVPNGVIPSLFIVKSVPSGVGFIDTTFNDNIISYQLPTKTFFQGWGGFPGIRLTLHFDGTVPVELLTFSAEAVGDHVLLKWSTATETNNEGWDIEKSTDNDIFTRIGFVEGAGTSTELHTYSYQDNNELPGIYFYRLKQIDYDGTFEYSNTVEVNFGIPQKFSLEQNFPNPFNPATNIKYTIPQTNSNDFTEVQLVVYDLLGNEIAILVNKKQPAGNYEISFNAGNLSSGIYFYQLRAGSFFTAKKMVYLK